MNKQHDPNSIPERQIIMKFLLELFIVVCATALWKVHKVCNDWWACALAAILTAWHLIYRGLQFHFGSERSASPSQIFRHSHPPSICNAELDSSCKYRRVFRRFCVSIACSLPCSCELLC